MPSAVQRERIFVPVLNVSSISNAGRWMLNRRSFLGCAGTGLSAIALTSLLAADARLRNPLEPRSPPFTPKAKRVLMLFCSGALSHLDTWDYKPELIKRNGQPMPGMD